jgi:hypothetical protein
MRIYIIGNDGITLCREPPAAVNEGEIVVASNEELHTARLSGKRLLALWNALPGVEKQKKVGDREALIDQLWSAIEMLPDPQPQSDTKRPSKQEAVIAMLQRPEGANGRRGGRRDGLAAAHGPGALFGNPPRWFVLRQFLICPIGRSGGRKLKSRAVPASGLHETRRWRKADSNSRSHQRATLARGVERDRGFVDSPLEESGFEPESHPYITGPPPHRTTAACNQSRV